MTHFICTVLLIIMPSLRSIALKQVHFAVESSQLTLIYFLLDVGLDFPDIL
jgi:hypothetical protein